VASRAKSVLLIQTFIYFFALFVITFVFMYSVSVYCILTIASLDNRISYASLENRPRKMLLYVEFFISFGISGSWVGGATRVTNVLVISRIYIYVYIISISYLYRCTCASLVNVISSFLLVVTLPPFIFTFTFTMDC